MMDTMTGTPQSRVKSYFETCAQQIALQWVDHYDQKVPPKEILDAFDQAVANAMATEPDLAQGFNRPQGRSDLLTSDLLDILILAARDATERMIQKRAEEQSAWVALPLDLRIQHLERRRATYEAAGDTSAADTVTRMIQQTTENESARVKKQTRQDRLTYLRAKREALNAKKARRSAEIRLAHEERAKAAELEEDRRVHRFNVEVLSELRRCGRLTTPDGSVTFEAAQEILATYANTIIEAWPDHGGQAADADLLMHLYQFPIALFQGVNVNTSEWDIVLDDGKIQRPENIEAIQTLTTASFHSLILTNARPHFTYEAHTPWGRDELRQGFVRHINHISTSRAAREQAERQLLEAAGSLHEWQALHPAPPSISYGVSPAGAEKWCCDWLTHMGLQDATVTQFSGDGGIDIVSPSHVAQVKHYAGAVTIAEIRELAGVAAVDGRKPIFMTSGKYPTQAAAFADSAGMLLFTYDVLTGAVTGNTYSSHKALEVGFVGTHRS